MGAQVLTQSNIEAAITENPIVILDFWSPTCGPCLRFAPVFEDAATRHEDVVFGKINTHQEREIAMAYQIQAVPTLMVFRDQILLHRQPGAMPAEMFEELIGKVKAIDMDAVRADIAKRGEE